MTCKQVRAYLLTAPACSALVQGSPPLHGQAWFLLQSPAVASCQDLGLALNIVGFTAAHARASAEPSVFWFPVSIFVTWVIVPLAVKRGCRLTLVRHRVYLFADEACMHM